MNVETFAEKALQFLASAEKLLVDGDPDSSVSRAYYAMLYAARAALWASGAGDPETTKTHDGVIRRFSEHFIRSGDVPVELGKAFAATFQLRGVADYGGVFLDVEEAAVRLDLAKRFVEAALALTKQNSAP